MFVQPMGTLGLLSQVLVRSRWDGLTENVGEAKSWGLPACRVMPGMTAQSFGILLRAFSTAIMHWGWFLKWFMISYHSNDHDPNMAIQTKESQYKSSNSSRFKNAKVSSFLLPILAWLLWIFPSQLNWNVTALSFEGSLKPKTGCFFQLPPTV